jgi:hypothetical protein
VGHNYRSGVHPTIHDEFISWVGGAGTPGNDTDGGYCPAIVYEYFWLDRYTKPSADDLRHSKLLTFQAVALASVTELSQVREWLHPQAMLLPLS